MMGGYGIHSNYAQSNKTCPDMPGGRCSDRGGKIGKLLFFIFVRTLSGKPLETRRKWRRVKVDLGLIHGICLDMLLSIDPGHFCLTPANPPDFCGVRLVRPPLRTPSGMGFHNKSGHILGNVTRRPGRATPCAPARATGTDIDAVRGGVFPATQGVSARRVIPSARFVRKFCQQPGASAPVNVLSHS
jgi:hypothetical protein